MGIDVGNNGTAIAAMNVVPLIDILLVLIIIFMVITPLAPRGLEAVIPQPARTEPPNKALAPRAVVVRILDSRTLKINEEDATWDSLGARLAYVFRERSQKVAFVQGENAVRFSEVARAIDIMRSSGIEKVGLMTAKLDVRQ